MRVRLFNVAVAVISAAGLVFNAAAFVMSVAVLPEEPLVGSLVAPLHIGAVVLMARLMRRAVGELHDGWLAARMNVRVVRDGEEIPCVLYRIGVHDGVMEWAIVEPEIRFGDELRADMIPARTGLVWVGMDE